MKRFRVALARLLLRGTACSIARTEYLVKVKAGADALQDYIIAAGGMPDSSHVRAYRRMIRESTAVADLAQQIRIEA